MNILIIGCGKVGSGLANSLCRAGHDIAIVDADKEHFSLLDEDFTGYAVVGVPIDQEVLQEAGIESCDCVAAVTEDDNINVMVSQIAREFFHVPKVITRVYDPRRKRVFSQLGLNTISPTSLTVDVIEKMISGKENETSNQVTVGETVLSVLRTPVPKEFYGAAIRDVGHDDSETIIGVQQKDGTTLLRESCRDYTFHEGDQLLYVKIL